MSENNEEEWTIKRILPERPALPNIRACLHLRQKANLVFGKHVVVVELLRRYPIFRQREEFLNKALVELATAFCQIFHTEICLVAHDRSSAYHAALKGATFDEIVSQMHSVIGLVDAGWHEAARLSSITRWVGRRKTTVSFKDNFYLALQSQRERGKIMKEIGTVNGYTIYWDAQSGEVQVGNEDATEANGSSAVAYSEARAMEVARDYIRRALGG